MRVICVLSVCLLTLVSCTETEHAEKGIGKKDITGYSDTGFYSTDGVCAFTAQNRNQVAVNTKRLTYRLQNPDQSQYVHVKFVEKPEAVGQKVKVSFTFQGISFLKGETEEMEVVRVDEGKVWLSGDNAGIIIPFF